MNLPKTVFRKYDIRGVVPVQINEEASLHIGKALGTHLVKKLDIKNPSVVTGRDNRETSMSNF